jgi:hypothetical protein
LEKQWVKHSKIPSPQNQTIMRKPLLLLFTVFSFGFLQAQKLDTVRIKTTGLDGGIEVSTDDAEQINNEMDKLYDDDLDMGWEGDEFNVVSTGLRFTGVNVPKGARIDSAFIEIFAHEDEGDPAFITIIGEASDNPVTYDDVNLISDRPQTTATVRWEVTEDWTIWTKYRTPAITSIVQEIVDRGGWAAGNAMAFFFTGEDQGASSEDNARDFESFENVEDPDDGGDGLNHPERIPKLYIYYTETTSVNDLEIVVNIQISPNPTTTGEFTIDLTGFNGENVDLQLFNMNGQLVQSWIDVSSIRQTLNLNTISGNYILRIIGKSKVGTTQLTKL